MSKIKADRASTLYILWLEHYWFITEYIALYIQARLLTGQVAWCTPRSAVHHHAGTGWVQGCSQILHSTVLYYSYCSKMCFDSIIKNLSHNILQGSTAYWYTKWHPPPPPPENYIVLLVMTSVFDSYCPLCVLIFFLILHIFYLFYFPIFYFFLFLSQFPFFFPLFIFFSPRVVVFSNIWTPVILQMGFVVIPDCWI